MVWLAGAYARHALIVSRLVDGLGTITFFERLHHPNMLRITSILCHSAFENKWILIIISISIVPFLIAL
jgi:hypothetical protein